MICFLESGSSKLPSITVLGLMCNFISSSIYVTKSSTSVFSVYIIQNGCVILSVCYPDQYEVSFSVSSSKCWLDIYFVSYKSDDSCLFLGSICLQCICPLFKLRCCLSLVLRCVSCR